jgi:hypothetical protein
MMDFESYTIYAGLISCWGGFKRSVPTYDIPPFPHSMPPFRMRDSFWLNDGMADVIPAVPSLYKLIERNV